MSTANNGTFANRDSHIPTVSVTAAQGDSPSPANSERKLGKREALKQSISSSKLKEKLEGLEGQKAESSSLQDRLFTMYGRPGASRHDHQEHRLTSKGFFNRLCLRRRLTSRMNPRTGDHEHMLIVPALACP